MQNIIRLTKEITRHSKKSKQAFINEIEGWVRNNLTNYDFKLQSSVFNINFKELIYICLLLVNAIFLYMIMQDIIWYKILDIFFIFAIYFIQFKSIIFVLSILIPSTNIILSKKFSKKNLPQIIICAHYDTKHSCFKLPQSRLKQFVKRNVYGISRILGNLISKSQSYTIACMIFMYIILLINFDKGSQNLENLTWNFEYVINLYANIGFLLIINSIFCAIVTLVFTLPITYKTYNQGADDNTSGVVASLLIAKRLQDNYNINLKIVLFDNEEKGMIGSTHFAIKNNKLLNNNSSTVINLDCIGRGETIYLITDKFYNNKCLNIIRDYMNQENISFEMSDMDFSDHKPFLQFGIDSISISRCNKKKYLWNKSFPQIDWIHGSDDNFEYINQDYINEVVDVVVNSILSYT